jgi:hypothetical protein
MRNILSFIHKRNLLQSSLQRHNTPHPKDLRTWRNKVAKKFQATDGTLLHHDHQHPFQPNSHIHRDSTQSAVSSGQSVSSTAAQNRTVPGKFDLLKKIISIIFLRFIEFCSRIN